MKNKKAEMFQIALIIIAIVVTGLFVYGIRDLQKQKSEGNQTVKTFGEFLSDVFKKTEVKETAKDAEKTLGCLAKVNECKMRDITCIPIYEPGKITFVMTNMVKKINYDLNDVKISIEAGNCSGNLTGPSKLYGSGGAGSMRGNYTISCDFDKCMLGNITMSAFTKEKVRFEDRGLFSIKN